MRTKQEYQDALKHISHLASMYIGSRHYEAYFTEKEYLRLTEEETLLQELIDSLESDKI